MEIVRTRNVGDYDVDGKVNDSHIAWVSKHQVLIDTGACESGTATASRNGLRGVADIQSVRKRTLGGHALNGKPRKPSTRTSGREQDCGERSEALKVCPT